ncbi:MAG: hypothetical protein MR308_01215 [Lachnospiraceae bacterium]|nr:hypothetical protein [Lachnospiraceae bacterium]
MTFTIYFIHHSHTDIGYTEYQEKVERNQVAYIRHAIRILDRIHADKPRWKGFIWQCECWWAVEKFLESATALEQEKFWHYVETGEIGLSANYLNMTELIDGEILAKFLKRAGICAAEKGIKVPSAMTADINGYSWGYGDALAEAGVENLLSFVHTHHGRYPLFQKQKPFWWQTPSGKEILVWLGDHYQVGNELGASQLAAVEYTCWEDGLGALEQGDSEKAVRRIFNYVDTLKNQGDSIDFTVVGLSGYLTDNACPSPLTVEFMEKFNREYGNEICLKLVTLDEFFARLREEDKKNPFPKYAGDWTDWWADGVGSTPVHVQHFREAQRDVHLGKLLQKKGIDVNNQLLEAAQSDLMLYAEHTWGHSESVTHPYDPGVARLDLRKGLYAQRANESASRALLLAGENCGTSPFLYGQGEPEFFMINPHDEPVEDTAFFDLEEIPREPIDVVDAESGTPVLFQTGPGPRGLRVYIQAKLEPGEEKAFRIRKKERRLGPTAGMRTSCGADRVCDIWSEIKKKDSIVSPWRIENDWVRIIFEEEKGVAEIYDKNREMSLLREDRPYAPFTPIYEHTPVPDGNQCRVRKNMGRNRKSMATGRYPGKLTDVQILETGELFDQVKLTWELEGAKACFVLLTVYRKMPKIDVNLQLHKECVQDPENLYLALPFTGGKEDTCWIEKTGCALRPRIDQLPGSCADFYLVQNGVWYTGEKGTVLVNMPDTPLITLGELKCHPILLAGENQKNSDILYSWVMNNFWETNFKVDLGGFHQYNYSILSLPDKEQERIRKLSDRINTGVFSGQRFLLS